MRNFDAEIKPIQFILNGKTYTVVPITAKVIRQINEILNNENLSEQEKASRELALLTNSDEKEFANTDLRKLVAVSNYITEEITAKKNLTGG